MKHAVLVVGATGGVGQATARLLAGKGYDVIGSCRTAEQGNQLVESGVCRRWVTLKLDETDTIEAAFSGLVGPLKGIVNCAAITQPRPLERISMAELRQTFEINVFGTVRLIQMALPRLEKGAGRIVLVSSTAGMVVAPLLGAYSASKFALEAVADAFRRELGGQGIGISLVVPGGIRTPMIDRQLAEIDAELARLDPDADRRIQRLYRQHRTVIEMTARSAVSPERVARDVLKALEDRRARARYMSGLPSKATRSMYRFIPDSVLDQLMEFVPGGR